MIVTLLVNTAPQVPYGHQSSDNASMLAPPCLPLPLKRGFRFLSPRRLLPPWPAFPPPVPTPQAAQKAPVSTPQAHIHPRFLNRQDTTEQRVGSSSDSDDAAYCLGFLAEPAVFLSAFPDGPQLQGAGAEQHHALLDTGQRPFSDNSRTKRVHIDKPQHSAVGNTDSPGAAEAAIPSALDNSDADYSDSIHDDLAGSSERSASDSADNPSAAASTTHHRFDDERSVRGDGDAGRWFGSEAEARVPSSQLGGEPSACGA